MTTMDQYHYVKDQDGSTLWISETPPTPRLAVSRFRRWLFPAVTAVILLTVIIILGASNIKVSKHLWSLEQRLSNQKDVFQSLHSSVPQVQDVNTSNRLSFVEQRVFNLIDVIQLLNDSLKHIQDTDTSNRLLSVEQRVSSLTDATQLLSDSLRHTEEMANDLHQLKLAVGNNKDQLTSVTKTLKKLSVIDSLSKSVAAIKCTIKLILNNSSDAGDCCPVGWTGFESSCYFFSSESQSWNESRDWCETQQAHLIILHTDKQWDFVINQTIPQYFWVGLSDWRTGSWEWVDQTLYTVERRRWKPGQPDNWAHHGLGPGNEDCAHLHNDGRLNDQHCSIKERFICQKDNLRV
ncbi:asialoglycoprotein receptor 1-like isoform X2 [Astatotilapia calliptera]|uniref:asialoglycoprotein receptor 1-like isoform X2 n=1 Tax=Astatotilapia calliptera TaxID=8154 RepID=UPI000E3FF54A|nr:asialoglycoprotein receptor 1-like isoform X2 [Astatotilapia calliptera]